MGLFDRHPTMQIHVCKECGREFETDWVNANCCIGCPARNVNQRQASYFVPPAFTRYLLDPMVRLAIEKHTLIVLAGTVGSGKTTQAHLALRELSRKGKVEFISASSLSRSSKEELAAAYAASAVCLDDVGRRLTPAIYDSLCEILDQRHAYLKPTIITTNERCEDMAAADERLADRLKHGKWVPIVSASHRGQA